MIFATLSRKRRVQSRRNCASASRRDCRRELGDYREWLRARSVWRENDVFGELSVGALVSECTV